MRPQKVQDIEILTGLTKVFRSKGYEGASLKDLSEATGLKKASLYHRFPNGKQEMAAAVMNHLDEWVEEHIFQALLDTTSTPQVRLKNGISAIKELYNGGDETCIFRAMSMQGGLELFEEQVKNGIGEWINTFEQLGIAFQLSTAVAKAKAIETVIEIQGSLIVTKGRGDTKIFENTLKNIEQNYTH